MMIKFGLLLGFGVSATKCYPPVGKHLRMLLSEMSCPIRNLLVSAQLPELAVLLSGGATHSKVGIAFRTLCSKREFDAMRYAIDHSSLHA